LRGKDYILGVNESELERLKFQHYVWKPVTDSFFDRLNIQKGWKCLDVGAGPGFVSKDLRERVGSEGQITALEPSKMFLDYLQSEIKKNEWKNIKLVNGRVEETALMGNYFDFIFIRWVIAFVPDTDLFLEKLISFLKPSGIIAFQDYAYEGLMLYPKGGAFDKAHDVVIKYYEAGGGDPYIGAKLPSMFKKYGIKLIDYKPNCLAGDPSSGVYQWADKFFTGHIPKMIDVGAITQKEGDELLEDWLRHKEDENSIFFSPLVVDVAGRK
jgi:ubiquinone/menaquinone biosynthesis C-methylase UbiE